MKCLLFFHVSNFSAHKTYNHTYQQKAHSNIAEGKNRVDISKKIVLCQFSKWGGPVCVEQSKFKIFFLLELTKRKVKKLKKFARKSVNKKFKNKTDDILLSKNVL